MVTMAQSAANSMVAQHMTHTHMADRTHSLTHLTSTQSFTKAFHSSCLKNLKKFVWGQGGWVGWSGGGKKHYTLGLYAMKCTHSLVE